MPETVSTGGMTQIHYPKGHKPPVICREVEYEIDEAYKRAKERKAREKRRKNMWWIILILIVLLGITIWFLTRK